MYVSSELEVPEAGSLILFHKMKGNKRMSALFFHQLKVIYLRFLRVIKVLLLSRNFIDISYTIVMLESPILYVDTGLMIKTLSSLSCKGSIKNSFLWKMLSDLTCTIVLLIHLLIFCVLSIKVILPQINCH